MEIIFLINILFEFDETKTILLYSDSNLESTKGSLDLYVIGLESTREIIEKNSKF